MRWYAAVFATLLLAACGRSPAPYHGGHVEELTRTDLVVGHGPEAKPGMRVQVDYTGWLYEQTAPDKHGRKFDSSHDHGEPFSFVLGAGQVIPGWDQGVAGMHVGGKRRLVIPPELGYGQRGAGDAIPPNAALVFEVDLLDVRPAQ